MANKLFLVCATLSLCVLLTNASIYRTIVELDDDTNQRGSQQKCQREFQQEQQLRVCQQWIRQQLVGSPFSEDDDIENPSWGPQQGPSLREQCCNELYQEDQECVCPTLKQAAKSIRLQGQHGPFQSTRIYQIAKNLPKVCNMQQVGTCPFIAIPFFPPY